NMPMVPTSTSTIRTSAARAKVGGGTASPTTRGRPAARPLPPGGRMHRVARYEPETDVDTMQGPMPAAFLGHGSPMNALERNRYSDAWRAFGATVPRPRGILVISAHWLTNATAVTAMERPR